ncbi:MAG: hypothetical protein AAB904_02000 [Patescibacteria group bacterium]
MENIWMAAFMAFMALHGAPNAEAQAAESSPTPQNAPVVEKAEEVPAIPDVLEKIAACESRGRHFDKNGNVLRGVNKHDIGKYQINVNYWGDLARELGHDIFTEEGNEKMALAIYHKYGTKPWKWSKHCWSKQS